MGKVVGILAFEPQDDEVEITFDLINPLAERFGGGGTRGFSPGGRGDGGAGLCIQRLDRGERDIFETGGSQAGLFGDVPGCEFQYVGVFGGPTDKVVTIGV